MVGYYKSKKRTRFLWGVAFLLYAAGHIINAWIVFTEISPETGIGLFAMWCYVNLGGAGTVGLVLFATVSIIKKRTYHRWVITLAFMVIYSAGTTLFGLILPADTPYALFNPVVHTQLSNMSWWVVVSLDPVVIVISIVFLNNYRVTGQGWSFWIGLSFLMYFFILIIWPITELKPLFYTLRTLSVLMLAGGGIKLSQT